ncbi:MAG TPA: hypothetical protein VFG07_04930 [Thermoplasmata archaeon]|nr:hypothetical protein [Thermoplasmata archaeon]
MDYGVGPVEWVRGRSGALWWAGFFVILFGALNGIQFGLQALFGQPWYALPPPQSTELELLGGLTASLVMFLALISYATYVPMPLHWVGVYPAGILLDFGGKVRLTPLHQVHLEGSRLVVASAKSPLTGIYSLTPPQVARLRVVLPGIG